MNEFGITSFNDFLTLSADNVQIAESVDAAIAGSSMFIIGALILGLIGLITFIPSLALSWRRLHDSNKSGAMIFLAFIPFVGSIIVLVLYLLPSDPAGQRFDAIR